MLSDDSPVGEILTRRKIIKLLGMAGAAWFAEGALIPGRAFASSPFCVARPQQVEGPYFIDEGLNRSDIRSDPTDGLVKPGALLELTLQVSRLGLGGCQPLPDAQVDLWQCDALGIYSDVEDLRFNTLGQKFLRGYQITDANGEVRFTTIYPGWYPGRSVHIHFKVRCASALDEYDFTSQLYFDDAVTERVQATEPYAENNLRRTGNRGDLPYLFQGGRLLTLNTVETAAGYAANFAIGLLIP